ncbi:MAG: hypothetical protein NE334_03900 [Lentisphaeraceae bacterium]|nr:hypothetical protein [Lentisphaeraceae bacterium]
MVTSITKILGFDITHQYAVGEDHFEVIPTEKTKQTLAKKKFLFRRYKGEYGVFGTSAFSVEELFSDGEEDPLNFFVYSTSPHLLTYSDLAINKLKNQVFLYDGTVKKAPTETFICNDDISNLCGTSTLFDFGNVDTQGFVLIDSAGTERKIEYLMETETLYKLDFSHVDEGLYLLKNKSGKTLRKVFITTERIVNKPIFVLTFNISKTSLQNTATHLVKVRSRTLPWSYRVIPRFRKNIEKDKLKVRSKDEQTTFSLKKTENDFIFTSDQDLILGSENKVKLELIHQEEDGNLVLADSLPHPGPEHVKVSKELDIYSELTVYI